LRVALVDQQAAAVLVDFFIIQVKALTLIKT
jgi:hypothetical protein